MKALPIILTITITLIGCRDNRYSDGIEDDGNNNGDNNGDNDGDDNGDNIECLAYPTCADGTIEQPEPCTQEDETCYSETLCGVTIWCVEPTAPCHAIPTCEPHEVEVDGCDNDGACRAVSLCGSTIYCELVENCLAEPSCEDDEVEVEQCNGAESCREVTVCGSTILCQPNDGICDGFPVCDDGQIEVGSCHRGDPFCETRTVCGETILCQQAESCLALPTCDQGESGSLFACSADEADCRGPVAICGSFFFCRPATDCEAVPSCNDGEIESREPCDIREPVSACRHVTQCNQSLACRPRR